MKNTANVLRRLISYTFIYRLEPKKPSVDFPKGYKKSSKLKNNNNYKLYGGFTLHLKIENTFML